MLNISFSQNELSLRLAYLESDIVELGLGSIQNSENHGMSSNIGYNYSIEFDKNTIYALRYNYFAELFYLTGTHLGLVYFTNEHSLSLRTGIKLLLFEYSYFIPFAGNMDKRYSKHMISFAINLPLGIEL